MKHLLYSICASRSNSTRQPTRVGRKIELVKNENFFQGKQQIDDRNRRHFRTSTYITTPLSTNTSTTAWQKIRHARKTPRFHHRPRHNPPINCNRKTTCNIVHRCQRCKFIATKRIKWRQGIDFWIQQDSKSLITNSNIEPSTETELQGLGIAPKVLTASWHVITLVVRRGTIEFPHPCMLHKLEFRGNQQSNRLTAHLLICR